MAVKLGLISPRGTIFFESDRFLDFWKDFNGVNYYKNAWSGISTALPLVAALTPDSFLISIIDENFEEVNFETDFDIVGITAMTQQATRAYEIARQFRERGVYTVIGGIHPTGMHDEAGQYVDTVIIGEAEHTWPVFIRDFLGGKPKPVYKAEQPGHVDLEQSPPPRYDLLKREHYNTLWPQTTRGCPHYCEFCAASNVYGPKFRHKTISQVMREIEIITNTWTNPTICFADDNMFVNRNFAGQLIRELMPLKLSWMAQTDISVAEDEEFLKLLYDSGCQTLYIGFESLAEQNLDRLDPHNWKLKQLHRYPLLVEKIQSRGIGIHASFMVGMEEDNQDTFQNIIDFIVTNHLMGGSISILTPYPGSRLRERLEKEGRLLDREWSQYNGGNVTFSHKLLQPDELYAGFLRIWKEIYAPAVQAQKRNYFKGVYKKLLKEKKKQQELQRN
jgi:radical SAM superfamily enzyme YgiQ (UPF0313 family)